MREEDICRVRPDSEELYRFPASVRSGEVELALDYLFSPATRRTGSRCASPAICWPTSTRGCSSGWCPDCCPRSCSCCCAGCPSRFAGDWCPAGRGGPDHGQPPRPGLALPGTGTGDPARLPGERAPRWQADSLPPHPAHALSARRRTGRTARPRPLLQRPAAGPGSSGRGTETGSAPEPRPCRRTGDRCGGSRHHRTTPGGGRRGQPPPGLLFATLREDEIHNRVLLLRTARSPAARQNRLGLLLHGRLRSNEVGAVRKLCRAAVTSHSASWLSRAPGRPRNCAAGCRPFSLTRCLPPARAS